MAVGSAKQTQGFADNFGGKLYNTVDYSGPKLYVPGTGDVLDPHIFGFPNTIEAIIGTSVDQSGVYWVIGKPVNNGVTVWHLNWMLVAGGEATAIDLSGKTVKLSAIGF